MTDQAASVGRMVHYVSYGSPGGEFTSCCRAAVITEADADCISLCVLNPTGLFFNPSAPYDPGSADSPVLATAYDTVPEPGCDGKWHNGGSWHWPARV